VTRKKAKEHGPIKTGDAVLTLGKFGTLKCKFLIHAVGPQTTKSAKVLQHIQDNLAGCIKKCLILGEEQKIKSISIPAISTGLFGFPTGLCAKLSIETVKKYLEENKGKTAYQEIRLTNIKQETSEIFVKEFDKQFPNL